MREGLRQDTKRLDLLQIFSAEERTDTKNSVLLSSASLYWNGLIVLFFYSSKGSSSHYSLGALCLQTGRQTSGEEIRIIALFLFSWP